MKLCILTGSKRNCFGGVYTELFTGSEKWTMPIRNWKAAMNRFEIMYPDRFKA
ncbi:hypothetical protein [Endozoicomonas atrinae]|uniref:hypothetical protein n=1 Tax=Endozoicomonas atrinae TaxID=1333660 RepID=UPI003AFFD866